MREGACWDGTTDGPFANRFGNVHNSDKSILSNEVERTASNLGLYVKVRVSKAGLLILTNCSYCVNGDVLAPCRRIWVNAHTIDDEEV